MLSDHVVKAVDPRDGEMKSSLLPFSGDGRLAVADGLVSLGLDDLSVEVGYLMVLHCVGVPTPHLPDKTAIDGHLKGNKIQLVNRLVRRIRSVPYDFSLFSFPKHFIFSLLFQFTIKF